MNNRLYPVSPIEDDGTRASKHEDLPRPLDRAVGFMRSARKTVGATSASLFLVDDAVGALGGVVSEWDWTRTSFGSAVRDWPTVGRALRDGAVATISAENATASEVAWFEPRGIASTVCVPLRDAGAPVGVLFFDFGAEVVPSPSELEFLGDVGRRCARALRR